MGNRIVNAGRPNQLAYDDTFSPVDHKRSSTCHQRQIPHKNLMFINLVCFFVVEPYPHLQRRSISRITFFTLFNRVLYVILAQSKIDKFQAQVSAVIRNRRDVVEHFF